MPQNYEDNSHKLYTRMTHKNYARATKMTHKNDTSNQHRKMRHILQININEEACMTYSNTFLLKNLSVYFKRKIESAFH